MRSVVRELVAAVEPLDAVEAEHRVDVLAWVDSGAELFRQVKPATPPKHLVSYCALVDSSARQVLLVDHLDAQLWLPPGGHIDPGEHPAHAAAREMHEELGITPDFCEAVGPVPVLVTVTQTVGLSVSHTDVSLWFAFEGSADTELSPDPDEFTDTRWWNFADVRHGPNTRFDPHLPRFIAKLAGCS